MNKLFPFFTCLLIPFTSLIALGAPSKKTVSEITDAQARLELARVLNYDKKYEEALKELEKLLKEKPDLLEAKIEVSKVYLNMGEPERALSILEDIPENEWDEPTREYAAFLYASNKQYDKSKHLFEEYLKDHPEDLKAKLHYAEMLSWAKKYPDSIREFEELLQKRPTDIQIRRKYALVLIWSGRTSEGADELRKTLK